MIRKLNKVQEFGIFKGFNWDSTVRDKDNNIGCFKKLNIIYGRNYSGKTTLSRIIRCFEMGTLHGKYLSSQFEIDHSEEGIFNQEKLCDHSFNIRVYNEDFVKINLKFLIDEQGHIEPFAIIGENNVEIENSLKEKEEVLGSEDNKTGLKYEFKFRKEGYDKKVNEKNGLKSDLEDKLRKKANNEIKRNPIYNDVTYHINDIKQDIDYLSKNPRSPLEDEQITTRKELLREEPKPIISHLSIFSPSFKMLFGKSKELLNSSITPLVPIQELLNDAVLKNRIDLF